MTDFASFLEHYEPENSLGVERPAYCVEITDLKQIDTIVHELWDFRTRIREKAKKKNVIASGPYIMTGFLEE